MTRMMEIVKRAKEAGYVAETVGKLLKLHNCTTCGKKTMAVFTKDNAKIAACLCGYRGQVIFERREGLVLKDPRCQAYLKSGARCKNSAKLGGYCGVHKH